MKTPSICLVTLDYPPETGGVARYLGSLVHASDGGIEVVTSSDERMFWPLWPKWWPLVHLIRRRRKMDQVVLVSHVFPVGTAAWIARLLEGPEYAVLCHGLDVRLARGIWKRFLLRKICRDAKAVFAASEATKRSLLALAPQAKVTVITPGVEAIEGLNKADARTRLGLAQESQIVLSVARLIPRKGIDIALKAVAAVQKERPFMYAVLGDGPDASRVQAIAEEVGADVTWLGKADEMTLSAWYAAADIFLLPVRDTGDDVEGFGIVYLEAAMHRLPSIAGKSGGASEAVVDGETGILVDPNDVDAVAGALRDLLADEDTREVLGAQGRVRAQRDFHWRERWEKMRDILL